MNKKQNKKINYASSSKDKKAKKYQEEKNNKNNENLMVNTFNERVGQGVKITVSNKLLEMQKNKKKNIILQKIIEEQENKIKILNQGVAPYTTEIENLKNKILELENENNSLKQKDINMNNEIENLKNKINEEITIKNELIESNKKLQQKIELLNQNIDNFKFENKKDQEEYNNMCKVKDNFEDKIIQLSDMLEKSKIKLQTAENVIKQKEKYIQMLINKKNNSIFYGDRNKEQGKHEETNNNNNSKRYNRPQSFGIKNKNILSRQGGKNYEISSNESNAVIIELENIIKKLKEKIIHLEKDNAGLLIRLKNINNLKSNKK